MIQINENIRITRVDDRNLQVEEYRKIVDIKKKTERYDWCWIGYYGDLSSAFCGVLKHCSTKLVDEEIKGCNEIIARLKEIEIELTRATKGANNET